MYRATQQLAAPSAFAQAFLCPANIAHLLQQLECTLSQEQQHPVKVLLKSDLCTSLVQSAIDYARYMPTCENLQAVNQIVLAKEIKNLRTDLSHSRLFHKYFVENDRFKVMPRGRQENEGEKFSGSTANHVLQHPMTSRYQAMQCFVRGST
jgi:hypothetical protein